MSRLPRGSCGSGRQRSTAPSIPAAVGIRPWRPCFQDSAAELLRRRLQKEMLFVTTVVGFVPPSLLKKKIPFPVTWFFISKHGAIFLGAMHHQALQKGLICLAQNATHQAPGRLPLRGSENYLLSDLSPPLCRQRENRRGFGGGGRDRSVFGLQACLGLHWTPRSGPNKPSTPGQKSDFISSLCPPPKSCQAADGLPTRQPHNAPRKWTLLIKNFRPTLIRFCLTIPVAVAGKGEKPLFRIHLGDLTTSPNT